MTLSNHHHHHHHHHQPGGQAVPAAAKKSTTITTRRLQSETVQLADFAAHLVCYLLFDNISDLPCSSLSASSPCTGSVKRLGSGSTSPEQRQSPHRRQSQQLQHPPLPPPHQQQHQQQHPPTHQLHLRHTARRSSPGHGYNPYPNPRHSASSTPAIGAVVDSHPHPHPHSRRNSRYGPNGQTSVSYPTPPKDGCCTAGCSPYCAAHSSLSQASQALLSTAAPSSIASIASMASTAPTAARGCDGPCCVGPDAGVWSNTSSNSQGLVNGNTNDNTSGNSNSNSNSNISPSLSNRANPHILKSMKRHSSQQLHQQHQQHQQWASSSSSASASASSSSHSNPQYRQHHSSSLQYPPSHQSRPYSQHSRQLSQHQQQRQTWHADSPSAIIPGGFGGDTTAQYEHPSLASASASMFPAGFASGATGPIVTKAPSSNRLSWGGDAAATGSSATATAATTATTTTTTITAPILTTSPTTTSTTSAAAAAATRHYSSSSPSTTASSLAGKAVRYSHQTGNRVLDSDPEQPRPQFRKFCLDVLSATQLSQSAILLSLKYIQRLMANLKSSNKIINTGDGAEYRFFTGALILANKFLDDNTFTNKTWSDITGMAVKDVNHLEVQFLNGIDFRLFTHKEEYHEWIDILAQFAAKNLPAQSVIFSKSFGSSVGYKATSSSTKKSTAYYTPPLPSTGMTNSRQWGASVAKDTPAIKEAVRGGGGSAKDAAAYFGPELTANNSSGGEGGHGHGHGQYQQQPQPQHHQHHPHAYANFGPGSNVPTPILAPPSTVSSNATFHPLKTCASMDRLNTSANRYRPYSYSQSHQSQQTQHQHHPQQPLQQHHQPHHAHGGHSRSSSLSNLDTSVFSSKTLSESLPQHSYYGHGTGGFGTPSVAPGAPMLTSKRSAYLSYNEYSPGGYDGYDGYNSYGYGINGDSLPPPPPPPHQQQPHHHHHDQNPLWNKRLSLSNLNGDIAVGATDYGYGNGGEQGRYPSMFALGENTLQLSSHDGHSQSQNHSHRHSSYHPRYSPFSTGSTLTTISQQQTPQGQFQQQQAHYQSQQPQQNHHRWSPIRPITLGGNY